MLTPYEAEARRPLTKAQQQAKAAFVPDNLRMAPGQANPA